MTFKPSETPKVLPRKDADIAKQAIERGFYKDIAEPVIPGFGLRVKGAANRNWQLRYQIGKQRREYGLGPFPLIGRKEARALALETRRDIKIKGLDPVAERAKQKAARADESGKLAAEKAKQITFSQAVERFFEAKSSGWKTNQQKAAFKSAMQRRAFPVIGKTLVRDIDVHAVLGVLRHENLWEAMPTAAVQLRGWIERVLSWATVAGYRSGENPARWGGNLSELLPPLGQIHTVKHHPALPYEQAPGFMAELRKRNDIPALALQFLILTTARRNEALHAKWSDVNLDERLWLCPIEDMKGKRVHIVPLSDAAVEILENLRKSGLIEDGNPFIFVGMKKGKSISEKTMARVLEKYGYEATPHGFRSTMRDWSGDETEHSREVAELSLAHKIGDATEQAYRRGTAIKKRRALMADWADYLASKHETGDAKHEVVPFRARKAK